MTNLPDKPFLINYNVKNYNSATHTLYKTDGQLFDEDAVLNAAPVSEHLSDGYISVNGQYYQKNYGSGHQSDNPFNRDSSHKSFTAVYKVNPTGGDGRNIFANRNGSYNYMIRGEAFHTSNSSFLRYIPSTRPYIEYIRIQSSGQSERKNITTNQIATASTVSWGGTSYAWALFTGFGTQHTASEDYIGDFYWIYITTETLTDEEIQQVIDYNEATTHFEPSEDTFSFNSLGGTSAFTITADNAWTATTDDNWVTLSQMTGSGDANLTLTCNVYKGEIEDRTGTITFTDSEENTFDITIHQSKMEIIVPIRRIIRGNLRIN